MAASQLPLGTLKYLYLGSKAYEADRAYYRDVIGAEKVWEFNRFGARVAAFRVSDGPLLLIADHRPAPSCQPIFAVKDLAAATAALAARGWKPDGERFEIPDGPCYRFTDPSGNPLAIYQDDHPDKLPRAYADPGNASAVRD